MKKFDSEFERLARTLEPDERKALLDKIRKLKQIQSIKIPELKKENVVKRQFNYAKTLIRKSNFFTRLIIVIISFFSNKKREEVVLTWMFNDIRKEIILKYGNLVDFKNGVLSRHFAEEILNLAEICNDLIPIINVYFKDEMYYYDFISSVLEKNFSSELTLSLDRLNPETFEIKSDFIELAEYLNEKDKRLKDFFHKLSFHSFANFERLFSRFELIIIFVNFDFKGLLYDFIKEDQMSGNVSKEGIHFFIVENLLEKLFMLLEAIDFDYDKVILIEDMQEFSKQQNLTYDSESGFSRKDIEKIKILFQTISNFKKTVPLKLIFQYFKNDILFSPMPLRIKIDVMNLYKEYKRRIINKEWTIYFDRIGELNLKKTLDLIFPDYNFNTLEFFNQELSDLINKRSPFKIKNIKRLNLILYFLETKYKTEIEKIVNKVLLSGNFTKDTIRSNLASTYYLLHNFPQRLRSFDDNFETDKEYGRKITNYLKVNAGEIDYTRTLRNTIIDINEVSSQLVEEVFNGLWAIHELSNNLADFYNARNVLVLNFNEIKIPGYFSPTEAIKKVKEVIDLFFKVYNQIGEY